ncbi:SDR family NAD(P)-dependent oxidoreductase [Rhodobacterales bacterium]|nr:SDR family NAD(P)-dependent oxidoreductase [Rhodobacterales bacterium]
MSRQTALVIGASGGIGAALARILESSQEYDTVLQLGRSTEPALDLLDEETIRLCADHIRTMAGRVRLVVDATGALKSGEIGPEKSWREIDPANMAAMFAVNTIGPALLMKHFLPLLSDDGGAIFATLSARVGSIGDNRLGGWYSYRSSKAALNQLVKSAAVELARRNPNAICVAMHPGTVRTPLTEGFQKTGLEVQEPEAAAKRIFSVLQGLSSGDTGGFYDQFGDVIPW